jgi:methyl-accepting chemotaxis protein
MNTGKKVIRGFGITLAIMVAIALVSGLESYNLQKSSYWVIHTQKVRGELRALMSALQDTEIGQRGYLLTDNKDYLKPYIDALQEIPTVLSELQRLTADNENQQQRIGDLRQLIDDKLAELKETIELHDAGTPDEALAVVKTNRGKDTMDDIREVVREMIDEENRLLENRESTANWWTALAHAFTILGTIVAVVAVIIIAIRIRRSITQSIEQCAAATSQVAAASNEIASGSQQQLTSLNETVTSLNQISSTAEEFKTTIQEFADRSRSVQEAAGETAKQAREGRSLAQQSAQQAEAVRDDARAAGESMLQFAEQMQRITEITDTVNEIAEQTKFLALNASIEAARAGEEGKGFAVVATQVRELANQSKAAAGNIASLIGDTQTSLQSVVDRIEQGGRQSNETAAMVRTMADQFEQIVAAFGQTADAMTQIAGGARQQEEGIVELVAGLTQIESASKETAASAEQTQKSIADIDQQMNSLNKAMANL